ncbi:MAG: IS66 family insertion sequence element accessory protein TnpB [Propionivibrio sp.]|nr:IS66 family insertion sequence element accessory protein TnpB [Propionivibrio sp.]
MTGLKKGKGSRRSRHEWQCLLAKFDDSGLGVEAFCRREAVSAASLYRWRGLLGAAGDHDETSVISKTPAFVDLGTLRSAAAARIDLKLDLGDGLVLHLVRH